MHIRTMIFHIDALQRKYQAQFGDGPVANVDEQDKALVDAIRKGTELTGAKLVKALDVAKDVFKASDRGFCNPTRNDGVLQPHEFANAERQLGFASQLAARIEQRATVHARISAEFREVQDAQMQTMHGVALASKIPALEEAALARVLAKAPRDRSVIPRELIDTAISTTNSLEVKHKLIVLDAQLRDITALHQAQQKCMTNEENLNRRMTLLGRLGEETNLLDDERTAMSTRAKSPEITDPALRELAQAELLALRLAPKDFSAVDKANARAAYADAVALISAEVEAVIREARSTLIDRPERVLSDMDFAELNKKFDDARARLNHIITMA